VERLSPPLNKDPVAGDRGEFLDGVELCAIDRKESRYVMAITQRKRVDDHSEEKLDAYLSLYRGQMEHFCRRVRNEWRITFTAWALLVALIYGAVEEGFRFPGLAFLVFLLPIVQVAWLYFIHGSEGIDKSQWVSHRREALRLLGRPGELEDVDTWLKRSEWKTLVWFMLESGMTVFLAVVAWSTLSGPPPVN